MSGKITTCLWFDNQAEEAANHYLSIFKEGKITHVQRYAEVGQEIHGGKPGSVLTVSFELNGHPFVGLNGGPMFKFNEAVSFQIECETQEEVDHYWEKLGEGGDPAKQQCGWLGDKFGVSWQIVPKALFEMLKGSDKDRSNRVTAAMLGMKKLDVAVLRKAYEGS